MSETRVAIGRRARPVAAQRGRATVDLVDLWRSRLQRIVEPIDAQQEWARVDLDATARSQMETARLLDLLVDISPDVSRAAADFCRGLNPGVTVRALRPGYADQDNLADYPEAQDRLDAFLRRLDERRHGGLSVILSQLAMSAYLRGALFAELVVGEGEAIDLVVPDPATVRFRVSEDEYGQYWEIGQRQGLTGFVSLHGVETIRYVPIDPLPGSPYGRPMAAAGIIPALFVLVVLQDVRRIIANQGAPRSEAIIDEERIRQAFPDLTPDELGEQVQRLVDDVVETLSRIEPDDTYVHASWLTMRWAEGALSGANLAGFDAITSALEGMLTRGLKTTALSAGGSATISEGAANRLFEQRAAEFRAVQQMVADDVLEPLLRLALEVEGIQADVHVEFASLRQSEALRDEQTMQLRLANAETGIRLGFLTADEASEYAFGHPSRSAPILRDVASEGLSPDAAIDGQESTAAEMTERMTRRVDRWEPPPPSTPSPLPRLPTVEPRTLERAAALFDRWLPEYAGMLQATRLDESDG